VLYRLKDAGYEAFLVGGAVRDLLLGIVPKDFDIATDAHPEEVKRLFRNCRLIGRRFHLAHVRFGWEIIEVATFRAAHTEVDEDHSVDEVGHRVLDETGRILRDNLYGNIEEDVWRRDFTANALYYNIRDFSVWDYVDGVPHAQSRELRMIGDPETRYREDPVRMLRAVRFEQRFDFTIEKRTLELLLEAVSLLDRVSSDRVRHELDHILIEDKSAMMLARLNELGLLQAINPSIQWDDWLRKKIELIAQIELDPEWSFEKTKDASELRKELAYILLFIRLSVRQAKKVISRLKFSAILGRRVDLRTPQELSRYFRDDVLSQAETQYAAG